MRIGINLASEPFRRERALLVASSLLSGLMLASFVALGLMVWHEHQTKGEERRSIEKLEKLVAAVDKEQSGVNGVLRTSGNSETLERNLFLNNLIARKGISWTRIFGDLEQVLPYSVRIVSVRPQVDNKNEIQLDMVVGCTSAEPIIELIKRLETSPLFGGTQVHSSLPPSQSEPLLRYRISVNYAQQL